MAHPAGPLQVLLDLAIDARDAMPAERSARQPGRQVLLVTGHLDDQLPLPDAGLPVLRKPYSADQLLTAVRRVLEGPAPR